MYRIEVAPGEETVFRTIEELAVGIRNGVVTPRARIYHHASQKWLPIGLHPHYKKALEMPAASAPHAPVTSATPIPTPSRLRAHPPAHSQPQPRSEPHSPPQPAARTAEPKAGASPKIPAPVPSPVIAMQNEVLRDLPVISIPEPLPWNVRAPQAVAPPLQVQAPEDDAPAPHSSAPHSPSGRSPKAHSRVTHVPLAYAPPEYSLPVEKRQEADAGDLPVPRPTARRSRRMGGRPFLLLGAAAALVVGTHLVLTATPSPSPGPSEVPAAAAASTESERSAERSAEATPPESDGHDSETNLAAAEAVESPRVTIAPARVPMTPGPAFSGSVPTRPGAGAGTPRAVTPAPAPAPTATAAAASIAPAPAGIELALPDLPPDSMVPTARTSDTMGMKKILRALNGSKPEVSASP